MNKSTAVLSLGVLLIVSSFYFHINWLTWVGLITLVIGAYIE